MHRAVAMAAAALLVAVPAAGQNVGVPGADTIPALGTPALPDPITAGPLPAGADTVPPGVLPDSVAAAADALGADTIPANPAILPDSVAAAALAAGADTIPADTAAPRLNAAADSILRALRALPGFTVIEYQGERAVYTAETGLLRLEGTAEVRREGERLTADTILFREREDLVEAFGNPRVEGQNQTLEGQRLYYDLVRRRATALGARTQITQEATWYVTGDMTAEGNTHLYGSHARFTSCDLAIPHYHFEADEVMVIRDKLIVARPARLYFGDVPVMVLPFVVQNLEQGRRSGLLTPRLGVNDVFRTSSDYTRQISNVGFYWAINDYMGAQLSTEWRSGAYTAVFGNYDFNWARQFLRGSVGLQQYWEAAGGTQQSLNTQGSWRPDELTNLNFSGRYASSSRFVREASPDPREVTQDLNSNLSMNRRFDWGSLSLGGDRRQSIATGDVTTTFPSFSVSPRAITLFAAPTPETAGWFSNMTLTPGTLTGSRTTTDFADPAASRRQDRDITRLRVGPSLNVGRFSFSAGGDLNRTELAEVAGIDRQGAEFALPASIRDEASWNASANYLVNLIGTTSLSPQISLSQQIVRDTLTNDEYLGAPTRLSFGASLNTDLYGFFPGFAGFSAIRHRFSPQLGYSYAPQAEQTELQQKVFGRAGGRTQNRIRLGFTQTFEAKLRTPRVEEPPVAPADTLPGDTLSQVQTQPAPAEPDKVTILSLNTSAFEYDFEQAADEGTGFVTNTVSNTINSDYLRGLSIQMQHELFDRRNLDPQDPDNAGRLGTFAPRLTSLSTSFQLGPQSAIFQWLRRFGFGATDDEDGDGAEEGPGVLPGPNQTDDPAPPGQGAFTGNPQGTGGGPWSASVSYQFSRPARNFTSGIPIDDRGVQTLNGNLAFQLTPKWSVNWNTSYSLTDQEFGAHRLNFRRDLHEWQANFSFYQTPNGNTMFEFYVELLHSRELRFDYAERNLGVDRGR